MGIRGLVPLVLALALAMVRADDTIEYTKADGSKGRMTREQLVEHMSEQGRMRAEGDKLVREDKGSLKLDEVKEKNPAMYQFMKMGKFVHEQLNTFGHGFGDLTNLASPPEPSEFEKEEQAGNAPKGRWTQSVVLTVKEERFKNKKRVPTTVKYEAVVQYNPLTQPKFAVIQAWVLDNESGARKTRITVPEPSMAPWYERYYKQAVTIFGVIIFSSLARWIRKGAQKYFAPTPGAEAEAPPSDKKDDPPAQAPKDGAAGANGGAAAKGKTKKRKGKK